MGQVISYECNSFPTEDGWEIGQEWCAPAQWVEDGWFLQHVALCDGVDPPGGQQSSFVRSLEDFLGVDRFFVEWRVVTDGDASELPLGGPANLVAFSTGPVNYRFSIASSEVELNRDNRLPFGLAYVTPGVPHTHRLGLYGDELYVWYVDGLVVDSGLPEGIFPSFVPTIGFRTKSAFLEHTAAWDYIRYGVIPIDGSGDFDSDEDVDGRDFYFFHECLSNRRLGINGGPGNDAGPGCRFADFDSDTDVDLRDMAEFQITFTGGE